MSRTAAAMRVARKPPAPRRPLRTLLRVVAWIVFVLSLPLLAWFVYNRIDEAPSADVARWSAPRRDVKDADNGWLYLYGIGAALDDEPIALGRRRVDAYLAREQKDPASKADPSEHNDSDPLPQVKPDEKLDGITDLCPYRDTECVAWAAQHRVALERLAQANRVRLERFQTLLDMPQFQEPPIVGDFPIADMSIATLRFNLLAMDANDGARIPAVAAELVRHVAFWRRASEQAETLVSKVVGFAFVARSQLLMVELLRRATPAQRASIASAADEVLAAPSAAALNLDVVASENFQTTSHVLRYQLPGPWATLRNCWNGRTQNGSCVKDFWMSAGLAPQASINIIARLDSAMAEFLAAMPADEAEAGQMFAARVERENPLREGNAVSLLMYNLTGKTLAFIALPKADWRKRLNDYEALRRMLVIKAAALRGNVAVARMREFVAAQPVALRNPYGDQPFIWDDKPKAMTYTAASKESFKRDSVLVVYP